MTTTTNGKHFTSGQHVDLARLVFLRFGEDPEAACEAWRRLLQNDCAVEDFMALVEHGEHTLAKDVAAIVAKHGATAVLTQLHLAADMVCNQDNNLMLSSLPLRRALEEAKTASDKLDKHLLHSCTNALGMISTTNILYQQEQERNEA